MKFQQDWRMIAAGLMAGLVGIGINHVYSEPSTPKAFQHAAQNTETVAKPAFPPWLMAAIAALIVGFVIGTWVATGLMGESK